MSTPIDLASVKTWHYAVSDKDRAQTTAGGAKALYKAGTIKPETLVWCTGMGDWKPVKEIQGLQDFLTTVAPSASTTTTPVPTSTPETKGDGSDESGWHYLDASQTQVGPISLAELSQRISNGQITNETYGWRTGLADWAPLSSIPELVPVFANEWFYVDKQKERIGPVKWSDIIDKYHRFELNHTTLAWRQGISEWKLLSEISDFDGKLGITADQTANNASAAAKTKKQVDEETKKRKREQKKAKKKQGKWVATEEHANVYVQGLPEDTTVEEAHEFFKKAGLIKEDPKTTWKIKLYEDSNGKKKGDALICYKLEPSVDLAIELLDNSHYRPGCVIQVQKAQFKMKGEKYVPPEKPKVDDKLAPLKKKLKHTVDKDLSWDEGEYEDVGVGLRIVILKHMFDPAEAEGDDKFYDDLKIEIGTEVEKKAGPIEKITVFNGNKEGAVAIKFKQPSSAEACIKLMNGRYFGQRRIECDYFDGKTNYKVTESEASEKKRQEEFGKWLEDGASSASAAASDSTKS